MYGKISRIWDLDVLVLLIPVSRVVYFLGVGGKKKDVQISEGPGPAGGGQCPARELTGSAIRLHRRGCVGGKE